MRQTNEGRRSRFERDRRSPAVADGTTGGLRQHGGAQEGGRRTVQGYGQCSRKTRHRATSSLSGREYVPAAHAPAQTRCALQGHSSKHAPRITPPACLAPQRWCCGRCARARIHKHTHALLDDDDAAVAMHDLVDAKRPRLLDRVERIDDKMHALPCATPRRLKFAQPTPARIGVSAQSTAVRTRSCSTRSAAHTRFAQAARSSRQARTNTYHRT